MQNLTLIVIKFQLLASVLCFLEKAEYDRFLEQGWKAMESPEQSIWGVFLGNDCGKKGTSLVG